MTKEEFGEFHRLLAILIYELNKSFYTSGITDKSKSKLGRLLKALEEVQKIVIVGACGFSAINSRKGDLLGLVGLETPLALNIIGSILINMIINMCLAMLILGYLDNPMVFFKDMSQINANYKKLLLRAFNVECDDIVANVNFETFNPIFPPLCASTKNTTGSAFSLG